MILEATAGDPIDGCGDLRGAAWQHTRHRNFRKGRHQRHASAAFTHLREQRLEIRAQTHRVLGRQLGVVDEEDRGRFCGWCSGHDRLWSDVRVGRGGRFVSGKRDE